MSSGCDLCCNILWFIFGGFEIFLIWCLAGIILCITIIGIPAGLQCFKIGTFALCPFGKEVVPKAGGSSCCECFGNIIWILLCGLYICIMEGITGVLFCITICGIPFGLQHFKLAKLALAPFGTTIQIKGDSPTFVSPPPTQPPIVVVQTGYSPPPQPY